MVCVFKKPGAAHINNVELGKHGRNRSNVWNYPGMNSFGADRDALLAAHPTVKPLRMIADAIMDVTYHGDIVFDGFLGSGTALLAAEQTKRICYATEIDPRYVDVSIKRWMAETGETPVLESTGQSFEDVAADRLSAVASEVQNG
jgi:DNA modification methylase